VPVVQQLRQYGEVRRGWLGVKIQSVTEDMSAQLGLPENTGALIAAVTPDGPAAKGGMQAGDVITRFDNEEVSGMRTLPRLVAQAPIDKQVDVEILRKGEKKALKVTVGRLTEEDEAKAEGKAEGKSEGGPAAGNTVVLGLKLLPLTDALRAKYGIAADVKGAIVDDVDPKSPAASKVQAGDVIVQAASEPVSDPEDVAKRIANVKKGARKTVMLELEDAKGGHRFVTVPVE
jgi:serine protease Do